MEFKQPRPFTQHLTEQILVKLQRDDIISLDSCSAINIIVKPCVRYSILVADKILIADQDRIMGAPLKHQSSCSYQSVFGLMFSIARYGNCCVLAEYRC